MDIFILGVMEFAVIDIETTGLDHRTDKIIEIAIIIFGEKGIISKYQTLVDPGRPVPVNITQLTGITNLMLKGQPKFDQITNTLNELIEGRVFVAHNVWFDYNFIANEFGILGRTLTTEGVLCSKELAKGFYPNLNKYSLKSLAAIAGYINKNPHRADSDAMAIIEFFNHLIRRFGSPHFLMVSNEKRETIDVKASVNSKIVTNIPESAGIYYMLNRFGKPEYIGKASNLKKRVTTHFQNSNLKNRETTFSDAISEVRYTETSSMWLASLLEDHEIRKYWPRFNRAQKTPVYKYNLHVYEDGKGVKRLAISRSIKKAGLQTFYNRNDAMKTLKFYVDKFNLHPSVCSLPTTGYYNTTQHNNSIDSLMKYIKNLPYTIKVTKGRTVNEYTYLLFEDSSFLGFGITNEVLRMRDIPNLNLNFIKIASSMLCSEILNSQESKSDVLFEYKIARNKLKIPLSSDNGITPKLNTNKLLF